MKNNEQTYFRGDNNFININALSTWINKKASIKYYPFYLAILLMLSSLILAWPDFSTYNSNSQVWETLILKSNDLTNSLTHIDPGNWVAKKVFRLTIPVIMKLTHLPPFGIIILQYVLGYLLLVFCYKLALKILNEPVSSTFLTAGIVFLFFGRVAFYDLQFNWFDGFAYFFIIIALYSNSVLAIFLFSTAAAWTDERGFIALSIVLLYHQLYKAGTGNLKFSSIIKLNRNSIAVLAAILFYVALRLFLSFQFIMHTPSAGANVFVLNSTLPYLSMGMWTFLEGFWLLYFFAVVHAYKGRNYLFVLIICSLTLLFTVISGSVKDITRSGAYLVPIIFILLGYLGNYLDKEKFRSLMFACLFISFLFPAFIICTDWSLEFSLQSSILVSLRNEILMFFNIK